MRAVNIAEDRPSPAGQIIDFYPNFPTINYDFLEDGAFIAAIDDAEGGSFRERYRVGELGGGSKLLRGVAPMGID